METIIREAQPDELSRLFRMGQAFYEEMRLPGGFVPAIAEASWRQFMQVLPAVIFVAEHEGKPEGMLGAIITPDHYDGRSTATEMFWYADPGASATTALRLLRAYHRWAKAQGAVETRLTHMLLDENVTQAPKALEDVYRAMGYVPIEVNYRRPVPPREKGD